jgi:hypothetical protein
MGMSNINYTEIAETRNRVTIFVICSHNSNKSKKYAKSESFLVEFNLSNILSKGRKFIITMILNYD